MTVLASIPLATHHNLSGPIRGRFLAAQHKGNDVEIVLDDRRSFFVLFEEAHDLFRAIGPNLRGLVVIYDGRRVVVGRGN
jgi:hypothetical protein